MVTGGETLGRPEEGDGQVLIDRRIRWRSGQERRVRHLGQIGETEDELAKASHGGLQLMRDPVVVGGQRNEYALARGWAVIHRRIGRVLKPKLLTSKESWAVRLLSRSG